MSAFYLPHPSGTVLASNTCPQALEAIDGAQRIATGPESFLYRVPAFTGHGRVVACLVYFTKATVTQIGIALADPDKYGATWDQAGEEKERQRAVDTEAWLESIGYPAGEYDWGSIWAGYDPKGFSGGALVRYNE